MTILPQVTIRVTKVLATYSTGKMRFRGVPVDSLTHQKTSSRDFYYITVTPSQAVFEPEVGQVWTVNGLAHTEEKPSHKKHGVDLHHEIRQAKQCKCILPKNQAAFVSFISNISSFKGVGEASAEKVWDRFKIKSLDLMKHSNIAALEEVVTEKVATALCKGYEKFRNIEYAYWLTEREIPIHVQRMIFAFAPIVNEHRTHPSGYQYSIDPRTLIDANPYRLASCFGMDFFTVDMLVRRTFEPHIKSNDPRRMVAAVSEAIRMITKTGGHTVARYPKLVTLLMENLQKAELAASTKPHYQKPDYDMFELAQTALKAHDKDSYVLYPTGEYQLTPTYLFENVIALRLLDMRQGASFGEQERIACERAFDASPHKLLAKQKEAIQMAVGNRISCIIGGAGTGKTTVLHGVLTAYESLGYKSSAAVPADKDGKQYNHNIKTIALSCRAAKRLRDSINKPGKHGLRQQPINSSSIAKFLHETIIEDPKGKHLVVIDEASMVDVPMMYHIITNLDPNVRILLVGDHHQLPPINGGKVLSDIIESSVLPVVELDIVKRQSGDSGIPQYSKSIREGKLPKSLTTGSITFHEIDSTDEMAKGLIDIAVANKCAELYQQSPENSMVVASTNKLVERVNQLCQSLVNPNGKQFRVGHSEQLPDFAFPIITALRQGDPILINANISADIPNGSLGKLESVEREKSTFGLVKMDDDEIELRPELEDIPALLKGYGMTVHKAQGSQFPRVIVALSGGYTDRSWLYTAITRAEVELHIVSNQKKLVETITNKSNVHKRQTMLRQLLVSGAHQQGSNLVFDRSNQHFDCEITA